MKALALAALAAAVAGLSPIQSSWHPALSGGAVAGVPSAVLLFLFTAGALFWLDLHNSRVIARHLLRKARIEEAAAVLQASQFVSLDVSRTQQVVDRTFAMVREAMVEPLNDPRPSSARRES